MSTSSSIVTICLYGLTTYLIWRRVKQNKRTGNNIILGLILACLLSHSLVLYLDSFQAGWINPGLGTTASIVAWMAVLLYLMTALFKKTTNLGLIVLPVALILVVIAAIWPGITQTQDQLDTSSMLHILIAIPAFSLLFIAFSQAMILIIQEKQLRKPNPGAFFPSLPSLETMESNLFQLTNIGFILLTMNLLTGIMTTHHKYGQLFHFNHHILFSILAWCCFAGLLCGRQLSGWRGKTAAKWTIIAFILLIFSYFGARFVLDVILS